jgi:tetratricopeptide (TPR) repeat protein
MAPLRTEAGVLRPDVRTTARRVVLRVGIVLALAPAAVAVDGVRVSAQTPGPPEWLKPFFEPIRHYSTVLGSFSRPMSSKVPEAQAFFDQGFQMMYAFAKQEAVRSFREAWKRDPDCAICYWGEAWAWGSYLNAPMSAEESPFAYAAIQKAMSLRDRAAPVERDLIEAMAVRYVERFDAATRVEQDRAYRDRMARVAERHPDDLDIQALYADALFLLEPRRGTRDLDSPTVRQLHRVLEGVLAKNVHHPGACHLYVHATESTAKPALAEGCAEFLGRSIPGASHINHMPSHTWNEIGRWGDSVRANIEAWHSDLKAEIGEGFAIYPSHNLHMLLYAASMDGQGAIAIQAGKDYGKLTGDSSYHVLTLVRFGRFDEVAAVDARPRGEVVAGFWEFAQGYAALRQERPGAAGDSLATVKRIAGATKGSFRMHAGRDLLGVLAGILEGEIARSSGDLTAAIDAFERAVTIEDRLVYDEPEPLPFAARHWLGAALLEMKRFEEAERVYREELDDHPKNGWSLLGLKQALAGRGASTADVDAEFAAAWARADTWIRASRF